MVYAVSVCRRVGNGIRLPQLPVVLYWALVFMSVLPWGSGQPCQPCPGACSCQETPRGSGQCLVDCGQRGLRSYPNPSTLPDPPSSVTKLIIKENSIQELPDAFCNLKNLVSLDASNNYISSIPEYLFHNLTNLEELNLLGNSLSTLPVYLFAGLSKLKLLILSRNKLIRLQKGVFDDLTALEILSVNVMPLTTIDDGVFPNSSLQRLHLNRNSLKELPPNVFKRLNKLRILDISVNSLTTLSAGSFDDLVSLQILSLEENPWRCTCDLYWLTSWLVDKKLQGLQLGDEDGTTCHYPEFYASRTITSLQQTELDCHLTPPMTAHQADHLKDLLFRQQHKQFDNDDVHSLVRSARSVGNGAFQSSWNLFCRLMRTGSKCRGPEVFFSCTSSDGTQPILFNKASYQQTKLECLKECFSSNLRFGNFQAKICLCGSLSNINCSDSCQPDPAVYSSVCGKIYLPQSFGVTAGLSLLPVGVQSTGAPTQFTVSTSFTVDHFEWDFGVGDDETHITSTGSVEFSYFYPGDYLLIVSAVAGMGVETASVYVKVRDDTPQVSPVCQTPVDVSQSVNVSVLLQSGYDLKLSWLREDELGSQLRDLSCDPLWVKHRDRCLQEGRVRANYSESADICRTWGGELLTLDQQSEMGEILSLFQTTAGSAEGYLIGASRIDGSGNYEWDSSGSPALLLRQVQEPDQGNCVTIRNQGLYAVTCNTKLHFICQKEPVDCSHGGQLGPDGYCYVISEAPSTWDGAKTNCTTYPAGSLAVLNADNLNIFVSYTLLKSSKLQEAWIGLTDQTHEGYFSWVDNVGENSDDETDDSDDVDDSTVVSQWSSAHAGIDHPDQKDCVMLRKEGSVYTWLEANCSQSRHYVCQYSNHGQEVSVGSYSAGTSVFTGKVLTSQAVVPIIVPVTTTQTTFYLFPGFWFSVPGLLSSWDFITKQVSFALSMTLLVMRPMCPNGFYLTQPGCSSQASPYTQCFSTSYNCSSGQGSCPTLSQYCYLSSSCVGDRQPCSCASLPSSTPGCSHTLSPSEFLRTAPQYRVVGTVHVALSPGAMSRHLVRDQRMRVEEGDVLAYQHDSATWPGVLCQSNSTSRWRQTMFSWRSVGWAVVGDVISVPTTLSAQDNLVCYLRARFSPPFTVHVPQSMSYLRRPGAYRYSVEITGDVTARSVNCQVTAEDPVSGLTLIQPSIVGPGVSPGSVGTVPVEWRVETDIVIKVSHGSHLSAYWSHIGLSFPFTDSCPLRLTSLAACFSNSSSAEKPFSSIKLKLDTNSPVSSLTVSVSNDISSEQLTVDLSKAFRIRGLRVSLHQTQVHVLSDDGDIVVPAGEKVRFRATLIQGSSVKYRWKVNGNIQHTSSQSNRFTHIFTTTGGQIVQVDASNVLSKEMNQLHIITVQPAKFHDARFSKFADFIEKSTQAEMTVVVDVRVGANVTVVKKVGDGVALTESLITNDTSLVQHFSQFYTTPGVFEVTVTFSDIFQSVSTSRNLTIINPMSGVLVSAKEDILPVSLNAQLQLVVPGQNLGYITHTWTFGDGISMNSSGTNALIRHKFSSAGSYTVRVVVSNGVRSVLESLNITVEEAIIGLSLSYDGPKSSQSVVYFTLEMQSGSDVRFSINTGDGTVYNLTMLTFNHQFSGPGVYNVTVSAWNQVSSASTALLVYAMGADMLEVVSVQTPGCTALGSSVNLTAEVINTVPVPLFYTWIFGDQTTQLTQDKDTVTHLYGTPGVFTVQVYVNNTVKTKSASAEVCIQEEITALSLSRLSPLALRHDGQVTGRVSASVGTGSNITYSWQATTDPSGSIVGVPCNQCEDVYSFTFDLPGEYEILVTASNNISSLTTKTRVRVQEIIEGVLLSCQNCKDIVYLGSTGSATQVELIASILHGTSVEYSWTVDSGSPVISVGNQYTAVLSDVRSYTAAVVVSNDVSTLNDSIIVQVQEAVTGLHIDVSTTEVVVGQPITFHALYSTGSDLTFSWFLCQDCFNATSTSQAYTHQFTQSGIYDVSLVAWNGVNEALASLRVYCIDTISDVVMESDLTGPFVPTGELVEFSASVKEQVKVNITWDIELHNFPILTQAGWNCSYDFPVAGIYTIFLTATNPLSSGGTSLTLTAQEKIHDFKIDVLNPILSTDEEVNITVTKSAGTDILYKWSVMNGSGEWNLQSSSGFIVIQLSAPGPQQLRCEAVNNVSRAVDYVDVTVQVPISEVVIDNPDQQVIQSESQLFFQATIGRGSHLSYQWFLNDTSRELSQASHFTHMFQTAGTFRLILRVHNGISDISVSKTIIVQDAVKDLVILISANIAETGQAVHFNASMSAGSSVNFVWTFGDRGSPLTSAGHTVTHRYTFPDVYTIHLTASNNVSSETNILTLPVQDRVEKLYMTNCCGRVVPALSDLNFTAAVMKGTNVTYTIKVLDWTSSTICQSESKQLSCVFPRSGVFTLKVSAHNNVSDDKRLYVVNVETPLENIDVQPDGPGWDFLFQNQPITFKVIGQGVGESHSFEWQVNDSSLFTIEPKLNYVFSNQGVFRLKVKVWNSISSAIFNTTSIIHKFMCEMPIVDRVGQPNRISTPSRAVEFEAVVDSRGCLYYAAVHQWQVYTGLCQGTPSSQAYLPSSVYTRGLLLRIPRQVLSADIYCVQFTSGYKQTVVKQKLSYTLTLRPSPFVAIIKGGSEVVLPGSQPVTLDGSMSYDPDVQEGKRSHMMYTWNCSSVSLQTGTVEKNCFPQTRGKRIELDESLFLLDRVYTITLTVSLFNCVPGSDCRVAHAQQKIEISPDPVPTVSIDCLSCRATNSFQISPSQHVALRGQCTDCHRADNVQYLWTAMYGDNNQSVARKSLVLNSSTTTTGANVSDLVIRRGVLKDIHSYTFQLDVTKSVGSTHLRGEARLTLGPNHPPVGGTCSLYPAHPHIVPLESVVTVECQGWGDQDPGKSAILYRVSAERQLASGKMEQCVLYQGTMRNQSVYVSNWPDSVGGSPVTLRVDVQDEQGASTLGLKSQIWLLSPLLKPNESLSEHITTLALSHLRWLVKLHRPVALLQYSIAVLMELNRASMLALQTGSSDTDTQRRGEVREAITTALSHIPIETMQDIQQVAYALKQVSMYENEVQGESSHSMIHSLMKRVLDNVKAKVKQGLDCEDFAPGHLLLAVSNLVRAMNLHSTSSVPQGSAAAAPSINLKDFQLPWTDNDTSQGSDELQQADLVTDAVGFTEMIMSTVLQTQLQSEQLSVLHMGDIHLLGQRTVPAAIWRERGTAGCQFLLPPSLLAHLPNNEEIFQIMFVMPDNPFPWGYLDNFTITSQVPSLTFQYSNGSLIPVRSLPEGEEIQVLMYGRGVAPEQDDKDTFTTMLDTNSQYLMNMTNITIEPGKATRVLLDTSSVSETTRSALHVQVHFSLLSDPGLHTNLSVSTTVFLGVGYEASEKRYEEKKVLTEDMMEDEQDHRQFTFFVGTSSFQPQSHYSLTVLNPSEDVSIKVYVHLYLSSCQYFDPVSQHWESKGCVVGDRSTPIVTVCMCNHLTSFGASALVPPNAIDFADLARLDVANNPVALITCSILLASYILLVIICRRQDLKDLKRISRVPLCGIDGAFKYEVTVVTGRQMSAGTTAHIGIKLYGEEGRSGSRHLCKQGAFQRNCQDTFLVAHDTNLGKLWKVVIWHDNAGLSPSWYLIQVVVRDLQTDHRYLFLGECWLSLQLHNGFIQKEMIVADPHQQSKFSDLCWSAMSRGFSDQHLWVSLIDRPAQSRFTRTQRLTCCFTLLFTYLAVNIMWYGVIKTAPSPGARGTWNYLSWEEIVVGTVSSLLVFPVNILIAYIFRKTRSKENMFEYSQKPQTAQTVEMDADCGLSDQSSSLRRVSLRHELTQFYDRESSCDSLAMTTIKPLRRTNTLPKLPSEYSQDSLYNQGADSDSGVSSSRPKGQTSSMDSRKAWWSHDSIINHWPVMPEFKCGGEFTKRPAEASKAAVVEASLRISGIKVDDVDSDDGWSSCLDDLDTEDTVKDAKQKTAKFSQKQSDGEDWSLDDKEQWEKIEAEIFSEELPKKKKPVGEVKGKVQPQCGHKGSCKVEETSFISKKFTPRAEASLTTGSTCRRRSVGGSAGEATQHEPRKCSINSQRENSFDRMSVEANILFGRERDRTVSSIQTRRGTLKDRKMSVASRLSYRLNRMLLPRWCVYVAYGMCVVISSVSVLLILLYANQLGSEGTWRWIISLVISFLLSAFFMEPLKVIFLAVFVAAVTKQIDEVEDDDAIEIRPMIETNERLKDVKFKPLGGYALLQAKEDARKISRMHLLMRQCLAYFCLLWIIVVISHGSYNNSMHQLSRQIQRTYIQTNFNGSQRFTTIDSITTFWQWSTEILASKIHQHGVSDPNLILGPVRLMQTRSIQTTCPAAGHWPGSILDSSGWGQCDEATDSGEDTQSYGEGWAEDIPPGGWDSVNVTDPQDTSTTFPWNPTNTTGLEDFSSHTAWTHRTAEDLQEGGVSGVISWYSGGGYSQILGSTETETQDILTYLQDTGWLTPRTRAIMVEWTMWNPSQDLTSVVLLTVEFPLTGKAITSVEMEINQLLRVGEGAVDPQLVCQIILLVVSVYFVVQCCLTVKTHGCQTFTRLGYVMEMLTTALILVSGGLYVTCVATTASTLSQHFNNTSRFTSFRRTAYLHWWSRQINAWLGFLILLKIVKQLRFSKSMSVFEKTLSAACWKLLGALVLFVLLLCTYAHVGYLLFGRSVFGYHSFAACLVSMVGMIRGSMDYTPLLHEQPVWTHLYLFSFGWCVFGLIFSLVLAVLRDTYKLTHSQMFYKLTLDIHDYEMIEFMLKRFKQWAGIIKPKAAFKKVKFAGLPSLSSHSTFSAPSNYSHSSSSSDSYGLEGGDGCLSVGQGLDIHLDQLPARWEDVLMKIRQLEEMDHHEEAMSQQIRTIITERRPSSSQGAKTNQPNPTGKPPKGLRARSMSDTKGLLHFSRRGSKSGRKSVSPPASNQQRSVAKRPHSDQSARVESNPDNLEHKKSSFISRIFKKAW